MPHICHDICDPSDPTGKLAAGAMRTARLGHRWRYADGRAVCSICRVAIYCRPGEYLTHCPCCLCRLRHGRTKSGARIGRRAQSQGRMRRELEATRDARGPRHCRECGKDMPREAHGHRQYCDMACRRKTTNRARLRRMDERLRGGEPPRCRICSKPLERRPHGRYRLCGSADCHLEAGRAAQRKYQERLRREREAAKEEAEPT